MAASLHLARYSPRNTGRMLRAMRAHGGRIEGTPGLRAARLFVTADLEPTFGGTPRLTRWGYFLGWETTEARDRFLEDSERLRPFTAGAHENWSVSLDTVRVVRGDWDGWQPDTEDTPPLAGDEPLAVITYGFLFARHLPAFTWNNRKVVREMISNPGLGMMVGLADHPMARATFSLWRSKGEVVRFAYGKAAVHAPVQRRSLDVPWGRDWFFARFRPVASSGTWDGLDPLRELTRLTDA